MSVDLLLDMDDDLYARVDRRACANGVSVEEEIRRTLQEKAGRTHKALTENDTRVMRPILHLDLRR